MEDRPVMVRVRPEGSDMWPPVQADGPLLVWFITHTQLLLEEDREAGSAHHEAEQRPGT